MLAEIKFKLWSSQSSTFALFKVDEEDPEGFQVSFANRDSREHERRKDDTEGSRVAAKRKAGGKKDLVRRCINRRPTAIPDQCEALLIARPHLE